MDHPTRPMPPDSAGQTAFEELAQLVDAIPARFRVESMLAALRFAPSGSFESSYLIGQLRARIWDCLESRVAIGIERLTTVLNDHSGDIEPLVAPFAVASDLATVRLVLAEVLAFLNRLLKNETGQGPHRPAAASITEYRPEQTAENREESR